MGREERDPQDARTTRSARRQTQPTDRLDDAEPAYSDPVNPDWRGARTARRGRRSQGLPTSRQEFVLWLQYGGWRVLLAAGVLGVLTWLAAGVVARGWQILVAGGVMALSIAGPAMYVSGLLQATDLPQAIVTMAAIVALFLAIGLAAVW